MATITKQTQVDAPPQAVWAKLADTSSYGDWLATHVDYPNGAPELAEGASFKEKVTVMGMPGEVDWTVTRFEPGSAVEMEGTGPMGTNLRAAYRVEAKRGRGHGHLRVGVQRRRARGDGSAARERVQPGARAIARTAQGLGRVAPRGGRWPGARLTSHR